MLNKFLYSVSFLLVVFALFGCSKPVNKYTIKFEAIGKDAKVDEVNITYYDSNGYEIYQKNFPDKPKYEREIKALKGKTLKVRGNAYSDDNNEDIKIKISVLKGGKVVKEETAENEENEVSSRAEAEVKFDVNT